MAWIDHTTDCQVSKTILELPFGEPVTDEERDATARAMYVPCTCGAVSVASLVSREHF